MLNIGAASLKIFFIYILPVRKKDISNYVISSQKGGLLRVKKSILIIMLAVLEGILVILRETVRKV